MEDCPDIALKKTKLIGTPSEPVRKKRTVKKKQQIDRHHIKLSSNDILIINIILNIEA